MRQGDGKFPACGTVTPASASSASIAVLAVRALASGTRDATFGNDGVASISGRPGALEVSNFLELADGYFALAGSSGGATGKRAAVPRVFRACTVTDRGC